MVHKIIKFFILLALISTSFTGCYYDKLENFPNTICDTSNVSYSTTIQPIFSTYCTTCHSGATPLGGLDLSSYTTVNAAATKASFMGAIQHTTGFSAMPKGSNKLDACTISKIQAWINVGKPQ